MGSAGDNDGERATSGVEASESRAFSVYDLDSKWVDQHAAPRMLESLKGRPQVVALVYTTCTSVCPMTVAAMQQVEAKSEGRADFVLFSLDPSHDAPEQLAEFAKLHALSTRWTLLTGSESDVRALAAVLGVKFQRVSDTEIVHTNTLTVLDGDGRIVAQFNEVDAADRTIATLRQFTR